VSLLARIGGVDSVERMPAAPEDLATCPLSNTCTSTWWVRESMVWLWATVAEVDEEWRERGGDKSASSWSLISRV
jgi:hypothetical protein